MSIENVENVVKCAADALEATGDVAWLPERRHIELPRRVLGLRY